MRVRVAGELAAWKILYVYFRWWKI